MFLNIILVAQLGKTKQTKKTCDLHLELTAFICKNVITSGDDSTLLEAQCSSV